MNVTGSRPLLPTWASTVIVSLIVVAVASLIWSLAYQNRSLKAALATVSAGRGDDGASSIEAGVELPSAAIVQLDGAAADLGDLARTGGIAFVFTTTCPFCQQSLPVLQKLTGMAEAAGVPFWGISLHPQTATAEYAKANQLTFPIFTLRDPSQIAALRVRSVPTTLVVGGSGIVAAVWRGLLRKGDEQAIMDTAQSNGRQSTALQNEDAP